MAIALLMAAATGIGCERLVEVSSCQLPIPGQADGAVAADASIDAPSESAPDAGIDVVASVDSPDEAHPAPTD